MGFCNSQAQIRSHPHPSSEIKKSSPAWQMQVPVRMKARLLITAICVASGLSLGFFRASAELEVSAGVSIHATTEFYEPLTPFGTWIVVGSYGRCWHPAGVVVGWRPYCNGYWEWTDCGWYWVSDDPWGWACYHYGTWAYDSTYGWVWIPGVEWAPAWVYWREGGNYIGWVPCGPAGFVVQPTFFVFVESSHFHERIRPGSVIVNNTTIINNTTEVNNFRRDTRQIDGRSQTIIVNTGPGLDTVEKATGKKLAAVPIREADRQTFVSVPAQLKHRADGPAANEKSRTVQEPPNPTPGGAREMPASIPPKKKAPVEKVIPPERTAPQTPPGKIVPPAPPEKNLPPPNKVLPPDKGQPHSKASVPPTQPPPPAPVAPPGNPGSSNEKGGEGDKDKDHGH